MGSSSDRPWRGIVVTFTGVEEKPALSALVKELGGDVESALTIKVTHVVASGYGSPKYLVSVYITTLMAVRRRAPYTCHGTWVDRGGAPTVAEG